MLAQLRASIVMMALFTLVFGLAYPFAMTGVAGLAFPGQSTGSLVKDKAGQVVGSALIAQGFAKPEYLHPRPSAAGNGYDPTASGGSNLGPMDPALAKRIAGDTAAIRKDIPNADIPADAITTSGSGLDPDVSPENAHMQAVRPPTSRPAPIPTPCSRRRRSRGAAGSRSTSAWRRGWARPSRCSPSASAGRPKASMCWWGWSRPTAARTPRP